MKLVLILGATLFLSPAMFAQVSCSSSVNPETCKAVSLYAPLVKVPVEIVTAAEYKARLADLDQDEVRMTVGLYPNENDDFKAAADTTHFTTFRKHVLNQGFDPRVSFIRDSPSSRFVSRILVSEEEFQGVDLSKMQKDSEGILNAPSDGKYDPTTVHPFVLFSVGFTQGTMSTLADGGQRLDQMIQVSEERKKIHTP